MIIQRARIMVSFLHQWNAKGTIMKKFLALLMMIGCTNNKESAQQRAEAAVNKYIKENAHDASSYKSLSFGKLDSIYALDSSRYDELDMLRKNIVARYNDAQAKGASSTADSSKEELLKINNNMEANKSLSGLKIYHVSQGKNELGEMVMNRGKLLPRYKFCGEGLYTNRGFFAPGKGIAVPYPLPENS